MTLAPIFEEFFYRGYLQFTLTSGTGFWPAAFITSALMGAAHALNPGWKLVGVVATGGYGLVACLLSRRTGNLWMPIGLHAGWNWSEMYFYGVPSGGFAGHGHLFQADLQQGMFLPQDLPILPTVTTLQVIVRDGGSGKVGSLHIPLNK